MSSISQFSQWLKNEFFYSHLDYTYFNLNEFQQMLSKASLNLKVAPREEWKKVKRVRRAPNLGHREAEKVLAALPKGRAAEDEQVQEHHSELFI